MSLRNNVTFRTTVPYDRDAHPVGEEVARQLMALLDREVGSSGTLDNWRDTGFELEYAFRGKRVHVALAQFSDMPFDFHAQVASYVGWARRLLGYRDDAEVSDLIHALHRALSSASTFSEVAWHRGWYDATTLSAEP